MTLFEKGNPEVPQARIRLADSNTVEIGNGKRTALGGGLGLKTTGGIAAAT